MQVCSPTYVWGAIYDVVLDDFEGGIAIRGIRLTNLRYADDIILIAGTQAELQELLARVQSTSTEMGLQINVAKTAVMSSNTEMVP